MQQDPKQQGRMILLSPSLVIATIAYDLGAATHAAVSEQVTRVNDARAFSRELAIDLLGHLRLCGMRFGRMHCQEEW